MYESNVKKDQILVIVRLRGQLEVRWLSIRIYIHRIVGVCDLIFNCCNLLIEMQL